MITTIQNPSPATEAELDLACETLYRFLAAALSDPRRENWQLLLDPVSQDLAAHAADLLRDEFSAQAIPLGFGEAPPCELDLEPLIEPLSDRPYELGAEFIRVFGLSTCRECPPYETEYQPADDPFFRSQQMADIAGFYRAFGLEPGSQPRERPDFVALELEFAAFLLMRKRAALSASSDAAAIEQAAICQQARKAFFRDHMSWWLPSFALALRRKAATGFYENVGRALAALLPIERTRLGIAAPRMPLMASLIEEPDSCEGCPAACG